MATPEQERLDAIIRTIERLSAEQASFEQRLAQLEGRRPAIAKPAVPLNSGLETRVGLTLLNRVGVVTLIIGVAFFFKWAVDNKWIGPEALVLLGALGGLAVLALADVLWRKGQQTFAQGLTGAGVAIVFVSLYSAYGLYHLVLQWFAYLLLLVVTGGALALSLRYRSAAVAAVGFIAGYLTPLLLIRHNDPQFAGVSVAFLLCFFWNVWWTGAQREWLLTQKMLLLAVNGLAYYTAANALLTGSHRGFLFPIAIVVAALYFAAAWYSFRRSARKIAGAEYFTAHIVLLWGLAFEVTRWVANGTGRESVFNVQTFSVSLVFALYAVALISAGVWTRTAVNRVAGLVLIAIVIFKLYLLDVWLLGRFYRIFAFVALGVLLISTSFLYSRFRGIVESWWKDNHAGS